MATAPAQKTAATAPGLKRSLSIWQAVGLSLALMAPSMRRTSTRRGDRRGRAVPLAFLIAAVGVLFVAYTFARLCQYYRHSGSVYAFVGATLGPRPERSRAGAWPAPTVLRGDDGGRGGHLRHGAARLARPVEEPAVVGADAVRRGRAGARAAARRASGPRRDELLLIVEVCTVTLILIVTVVVFVKLLSHSAPGGSTFTWSVFSLAPGTRASALFLGVVFGFLSSPGSRRRPRSARRRTTPRGTSRGDPRRGGVRRHLLRGRDRGGDDGLRTSAAGIKAFGSSASLLGDLGSSYVGSWVGNIITAGTTVSAFGCCLACTVGAARMIYAMSRDPLASAGSGGPLRWGTPAAATGVVTVMAVIIYVVYVIVSSSPSALAENAFLWSGTIGTLILLVAYVLATIGMTLLVFVRREMPSVPMWQSSSRSRASWCLATRSTGTCTRTRRATATGSPSSRAPGSPRR